MGRSGDVRKEPRTVLLVEDNPGDARLVEEICKELGLAELLFSVSSGADALDFVNQRGEYADAPRTDLVLLDWHLPHMDGAEVLERLKSDPDHRHIPIIVATGSVSDHTLRDAYLKHANACITKPSGPDELEETVRVIEAFWLNTVNYPSIDEKE